MLFVMAPLILITGGSRSGKSAFAQHLAEEQGGSRLFIATSQPADPEMAERVRCHQKEREGRNWQTVEEPLAPAQVLAGCEPGTTVLLDCLTLWVSNVMHDHELSKKNMDDDVISLLAGKLAQAAREFSGSVFMVTNEVGLGIVPDNPLARRYRDLVGRCNQVIAAEADHVYLVSCGIPISLK